MEFEDECRSVSKDTNQNNNNFEPTHKFFPCKCMTEGMLVTHFENDEDNDIYLSMYSVGLYSPKPSLWFRIKQAWRILRKGTVYDDELILSPENAKELGDYLTNIKFTK
jgi:hypothetical protein